MNKAKDVSSFERLRPLCINFLKECSIENINKLNKLVQDLDPESVQTFQEYIILPFRLQLVTQLQEKIVISCVNFLTCVFKKSVVKNWILFSDVFNIMVSKISHPEQVDQLCNASDELKLSVCENILHIIRSATEEILNEMFSLTFSLRRANALHSLIIMLREEKSRSLKIAVLSTIGALTYNEMFVGKKFKMTEEIASESLASCFPLVSITLHKVACGDIKLGHKILIMALGILADFIVLVVGDDSIKRNIVNDTSSEIYKYAYKSGKLSEPLPPDVQETMVFVLKDESWFNTVSEKLKIIVDNLTVLAGHTHWKVRLEFVKFASSLLLKCTGTLKNCIPILMSAVFGLYVDDYEQISLHCAELLSSISEQLQSAKSTSLNAVLEDEIETLTSQLIKYKISANDREKLTTLRSLQGYIQILGTSINTMLFSIVRLERILLTLITLLEFEMSDLNLVEEIPATDSFDVPNIPWPRKRFKFFDNDEISQTVCKICFSFRHIRNSRLLIDFLIDKMSYDLYKLQCIYLIGNIIKGFSGEINAAEKYSSLISEVLEVFLTMFDPPLHYTNSENVFLETQNAEGSSSLVAPSNTFNKNKLQICLLLEAIANCSLCLKLEFKVHLTKVLCPVMEKTGSSHFIISQCGRLCLYFISKSCEYDSVNELIKDNADYITNILLINFHRYFYKLETAVVLRVAMEQCDSEALVLFRDLIFQILNSIDYNQDNAYFRMNVLFSVVGSIKKWFPSKQYNTIKKSGTTDSSNKDLKLALLDYIAAHNSTVDFKDEEIETDIDSSNCEIKDDNLSEETKPDIPLHVYITCEIFERCIHLQSTENAYFRMLVLETVELSILVLRDYEIQLHPLIHKFWSPFLRRFLEETFISKAFSILLVIAKECGDFVRHRIFTDVMPKLVYFLKRECSKSHLKCNFRRYQWTNDHSLQVLMLSEIGYLCTKLDVDDKEISTVVNVCLPYLEKHQPKILQDAATKSLRALATLDSDTVWFSYNVLYSENKVIHPPHSCLREIVFPHCNNSLTEIENNFE